MRTLSGTPASSGIARGPWIRIDAPREPEARSIGPGEAGAERERLALACERAAAELESIAERVTADGHAGEGAIFAAQAQMARDPALASLAEQSIDEHHVDAVGAVLERAARSPSSSAGWATSSSPPAPPT